MLWLTGVWTVEPSAKYGWSVEGRRGARWSCGAVRHSVTCQNQLIRPLLHALVGRAVTAPLQPSAQDTARNVKPHLNKIQFQGPVSVKTNLDCFSMPLSLCIKIL